MIFSRSRSVSDFNIHFQINGSPIKRETETKFLGVIIDDKLTWKKHITAMKLKMSRYLGIMYELRAQIPLKARLLIYHSFIQSHLNYCPLIWGFAAKSHIESLFSKQKSAMRAIMPGFVNYKYKDGVLPTHTKDSFCKYKVLTVHGIIAKNAVLLIHKIKNFNSFLPPSVSNLIELESPCFSDISNYDSHHAWFEKYNSTTFRPSIFFKGPLLSISSDIVELLSQPCNNKSLILCSNSLKAYLIKQQGMGDTDQWPTFMLNNITGLRKSSRSHTSQA